MNVTDESGMSAGFDTVPTLYEVGQLILFGSVLARVKTVNDAGFEFHCENGAWDGHYSFTERLVTVEGSHDTFGPVEITSTVQPPDDVQRGGYNVIIPWMRGQA